MRLRPVNTTFLAPGPTARTGRPQSAWSSARRRTALPTRKTSTLAPAPTAFPATWNKSRRKLWRMGRWKQPWWFTTTSSSTNQVSLTIYTCIWKVFNVTSLGVYHHVHGLRLGGHAVKVAAIIFRTLTFWKVVHWCDPWNAGVGLGDGGRGGVLVGGQLLELRLGRRWLLQNFEGQERRRDRKWDRCRAGKCKMITW